MNREAILAEIIELTRPEEPPDYAITRKEYAEAEGVSVTTAEARLDRAVEDGLLVRRKYRMENNETWYYWRPEDEPSHQTNLQSPLTGI